jgi:hypothetical protein
MDNEQLTMYSLKPTPLRLCGRILFITLLFVPAAQGRHVC